MELVKIQDNRPTTTLTLKNGVYKVEMYNKLTVGEMRRVQETAGSDFERSIALLIVAIKDWNIGAENADGVLEKLPVNIDNIDKLEAEDLETLMATAMGMSVEDLRKK